MIVARRVALLTVAALAAVGGVEALAAAAPAQSATATGATATVPTLAVGPARPVAVNGATPAAAAGRGGVSAVVAGTTYQAPTLTYVATARQRFTNAYAQPGAPKPFATFDNRKNFSGRHVFVVVGQVNGWYQAQLPMRPNGRIGWIRADAVTLTKTDWAIDVQLSTHTLALHRGGREVARWTVAVGSSRYPTPTGRFYLRELAKTNNPRGAYGPYAFGLSGYSNVLQTFGRGDGQIGVHGTNQPGLLGQSVSHGCIRMRNDVITWLAKTLPQGVPIEIRP